MDKKWKQKYNELKITFYYTLTYEKTKNETFRNVTEHFIKREFTRTRNEKKKTKLQCKKKKSYLNLLKVLYLFFNVFILQFTLSSSI